jgi:hypothetical protein
MKKMFSESQVDARHESFQVIGSHSSNKTDKPNTTTENRGTNYVIRSG